VNQEILKSMGYSSEVKLAFYWQMMLHAQSQLSQVEIPRMRDPIEGLVVGENEQTDKKMFKI